MTNGDQIIYDVIVALAEADGSEPRELDYTLTEYVDPEMLTTIVSTGMTGELTFEVPDHEVTVTSAGEVLIDRGSSRFEIQPQADDYHVATVSKALQRMELPDFLDELPCTVYQSRDEPGWPIDFISENCRELTGYDPNAFIIGGVDYGFDLIHPEDRDRVTQIAHESLDNEEPFSMLYRIQTADGTEKWVLEIGVGLFEEDDPIPFIGVIADVSSYKDDLNVASPMKL